MCLARVPTPAVLIFVTAGFIMAQRARLCIFQRAQSLTHLDFPTGSCTELFQLWRGCILDAAAYVTRHSMYNCKVFAMVVEYPRPHDLPTDEFGHPMPMWGNPLLILLAHTTVDFVCVATFEFICGHGPALSPKHAPWTVPPGKTSALLRPNIASG